jgi:hypothetical protein
VSSQGVLRKSYLQEKKVWGHGILPQKAALGRIYDVFQEAVACRQGPQEMCRAHLTGGHDTRLIVANLLQHKKHVHALTFCEKKTIKKDVLLARDVSRRFGLKHSLVLWDGQAADPLELQRMDHASLLKGMVISPSTGEKGFFESFFKTPCFSGHMGGEVLGGEVNLYDLEGDRYYAEGLFSSTFDQKMKGDLTAEFRREKRLMNAQLNGHWKLYLFITHVCRSFFNVIEGGGWERPVYKFISMNARYPFLDEDLLKVIFSIQADRIDHPNYIKLYERYFPKFLDVPFFSDSIGDDHKQMMASRRFAVGHQQSLSSLYFQKWYHAYKMYL